MARIPLAHLSAPLSAVALMAALLALSPGPVTAQVEAEARLEGRVVLGDEPIERGEVVLHRVAQDTAGELDTLTVGSGGAFSFLLPSVPGGSDEVYFASYRHQGVLYFGPPVANAVQLDSAYVIQVHDTVSAPAGGADLPVAVRYMIVEQVQGGTLQVTDLFQVRNPGERTVVAGEDGVTWSYPIPPDAREIQVGGGDVGPDASGVGEDGALQVRAPIPPGERQFILRYLISGTAFDVSLPGRTDHVEVLVAEPAPNLVVEGLPAGERVEMAPGAAYRRFVAEELSDARFSLRMDAVEGAPGDATSPTGETESPVPGRWLAVILAFLLAAIGLYAVLGPPRRPAAAGGAGGGGGGTAGDTGGGRAAGAGLSGTPQQRRREERDAMLLEMAVIDERLESGNAGGAEGRRLRERRADLAARVRDMDLGLDG